MITAFSRLQLSKSALAASFKTEFGVPVQPSTIIWRSDKPNTYRTISAISGFRDLISASVIPLAWARTHRWGRAMGAALYSDTFAVYPWMVDNKGEGLITSTPSMLGYHEVHLLRGQTLAAVSPQILGIQDVDMPLMNELLKRWEQCFQTEMPSEADERLFRSLNMANSAAKLPAGADNNIYDTIRSVALWASAFEILRPSKNQAYKKIYADLEGLTWNLSDCAEKKYVKVCGEQPDEPRSLPVWLFGEINRLRNDTLHGNPLPPGRLVVEPAKRAISMYAAPLYRMMLTAYLDLQSIPGPSKYQSDIEAGLATIMFTDDEQRKMNQAKINQSKLVSYQMSKAIAEAEKLSKG